MSDIVIISESLTQFKRKFNGNQPHQNLKIKILFLPDAEIALPG